MSIATYRGTVSPDVMQAILHKLSLRPPQMAMAALNYADIKNKELSQKLIARCEGRAEAFIEILEWLKSEVSRND